MGEAFAKSVATPDIQLFLGDLLAQPHADIPTVVFTSAPAEGATVSGTISLSAEAALTSPEIATGVNRLEFLIDGRIRSTASGGSASFNLDTTTLTDGRHELRVVAVNNAAAESEGYKLVNVWVNNRGRSVVAPGGNLTLTGDQAASVALVASPGDGVVSQIEMRHLGRALGVVSGASGNFNFSASILAYGDNRLVPVAVFSDGTETVGAPIIVHRDPAYLPGQSVTANKTMGLKGEYFFNKGGTSIAASNFSGLPDIVTTHTKLNLQNSVATRLDQSPLTMPTTAVDGLAVRLSGKFNVATPGEYQFYLWRSNDSVDVRVDGQKVVGFDNQATFTTNQVNGVFLGAGEHDLVVLAANTGGDGYFDINLEYRGPDGITRTADNTVFYMAVNTAPVLSPSGAQSLGEITEDAVSNSGDLVSTIVGSTISDIDPVAVEGIGVIGADASRGTWQYSINGGTSWNALGTVSPSQTLMLRATDKLRFVPDGLNADMATITYRAWDQTGGAVGYKMDSTANGGTTSFSSATDTARITARAVNDPPVGADAARTIAEDASYVFARSDFSISDPIDVPANGLWAVKIAAAPALGSLKLDGVPVAAGQTIAATDVDLGRFTYTPGSNGTGTPYTSFAFRVQDDGGTADGGVDLALTSNSFTLNVTPVNDPPVGTNTVKTIQEDIPFAYQFVVSDFGFTDPSDHPANTFYRVQITTLPAPGSLKLSSVPVAVGQFVTVADISLSHLTFKPAANGSGSPYTSFTFQVQDAGGGADLDPAPKTLTVNVTPVNDPPAGGDTAVTGQESRPYAFGVADFAFSDPNDSPPNAFYWVKITTLPALGSLKLDAAAVTAGQFVTVANINLGRLTFLPTGEDSNSPYTSFTFQVQDDGGGSDLDTAPNTVTINVNAVNYPPVVGALADSPDPAVPGQNITLIASGVGDPEDPSGSVVSVAFYRESNNTPGLQTGGDVLIGLDSTSAGDCSTIVDTTGLPVGTYTYYAQATDDEGGTSLPATTANTIAPIYNLDADGNGSADALSDGILMLRYLFDRNGSWNVSDALGSGATRTTRAAIKTFLDGGASTVLDADGNGSADALSDGILMLRYLFDPGGSWNVSDALGAGATRATRAAIKAHLDQFLPSPPAPGLRDAALPESPSAPAPSLSSALSLAIAASEPDQTAPHQTAKTLDPAAADTILAQWTAPAVAESPSEPVVATSSPTASADQGEVTDELLVEGGLEWFLTSAGDSDRPTGLLRDGPPAC